MLLLDVKASIRGVLSIEAGFQGTVRKEIGRGGRLVHPLRYKKDM